MVHYNKLKTNKGDNQLLALKCCILIACIDIKQFCIKFYIFNTIMILI